MVSKKFVSVFFVDLIFFWFTTATQNNTNLYDAVSIVDIWQPPTPPQDQDNHNLFSGPHIRKRT